MSGKRKPTCSRYTRKYNLFLTKTQLKVSNCWQHIWLYWKNLILSIFRTTPGVSYVGEWLHFIQAFNNSCGYRVCKAFCWYIENRKQSLFIYCLLFSAINGTFFTIAVKSCWVFSKYSMLQGIKRVTMKNTVGSNESDAKGFKITAWFKVPSPKAL